MALFKKKKTEDKKDAPTPRVGVPTENVGKKQEKKPADVKVKKRPDWAPDVLEKDKKKIKEGKDKPRKTTPQGKEDVKKTHGQAYKHLIRPSITEKASFLGMYNQYVFEVAPDSNKSEIKKAIKALYGVEPIKVNLMNMRGKTVRYGRNISQLKNWKKAVVFLREGDKIDVYEGV